MFNKINKGKLNYFNFFALKKIEEKMYNFEEIMFCWRTSPINLKLN